MSQSCLKHIENYWKLKTTAANQLFNNGNYQEALSDYKDALYRAEVLNNNTTVCAKADIPFIQVYIISCNNLANTYKELGKIEEAEKMLRRPVYYLLYLAKNDECNIGEIQSELRKATLAYFQFTEEFDKKETIEQEKLLAILKKELIDNHHKQMQIQ